MEKTTNGKSKYFAIKGKPNGGKILVQKFDRSFMAQIIQTPKLKEFYSKIKNYCLSFEGVKSRPSWNAESFTAGKDNLVRLIVRGGALGVCFALSPSDYDPVAYPHKDLSDVKGFENTPMFVPVRNGSDYRVARRLAADAFTTHYVYPLDFPEEVDYAADLRSESDDALIAKKLIRVSESYMRVADADKALKAAISEEIAEEKEMDEIWENSPKFSRRKQVEPELPKEPVYIMRYDKSFLSRIIQNEKAKCFYSEIKNICASLGLKSRLSWRGESFYAGRKTYLKAKMRGKTLRLYLALDPKLFRRATYHQKDVSEKKAYLKYPMMIKVRSDLAVKRAKKLIAFVVSERGLYGKPIEKVDYVSLYPYEDTIALRRKGLIKLVRTKVSPGMFTVKGIDEAEDALLLSEEFAIDETLAKNGEEARDVEDVDFALLTDEPTQKEDLSAEKTADPDKEEPDMFEQTPKERSEQNEEEIEEVDFDFADEESDGVEETEEIDFELADDDDEEDVTFELVEEEAPEKTILDEVGDPSAFEIVDPSDRYVTLKKYIRGFSAKMKQGSSERKEWYAEIKSDMMAYRGVKVRASFSGETFYRGRTAFLKSRVRGKTLCLFFALDADAYKQSIYHHQYKGDVKTYADTPMMIRIKSDQALSRALRLIEDVARAYALRSIEKQSFRKELNYEETSALVEKGLIKTRLVSVPYYEAQELLKKQNQNKEQ